MKHTISILVENEFGALARIAGLFSGRGYNIEALSVAPTLAPEISRMTIVTIGDNTVIEQLIKQLNKLVNVIKVQDVSNEHTLNRSLAFIKVNLSHRNRDKLISLIRGFSADISYSDDKCSIVESVNEESKLIELIEKLRPHGIMEYVCTGNIAMEQGKKVIKA
jgi:acetolactate synthase I/III small subunit